MASKHTITGIYEHLGSKGMWAGSLVTESMKINTLDENFNYNLIEINGVKALFKCNDEILANASDHCFNNENTIKVSEIKVNVTDDGFVSIYNNGNGIPIKKYNSSKDSSDTIKLDQTRDVYIPEVIFSIPFAGSSTSDRKSGSYKASVNSIGAKICNVHSTKFIVETADGTLYYKQEFNGIQNPSVPTITSSRENFTRISYLIDYNKFNIMTGKDSSFIKNLILWFRYKCAIVAMYTGVKVCLNDIIIPINNSKSFIKTVFKKESFTTSITSKDDKPWDLSIAIEENCKVKHIITVNGIESGKGSHIDMVINNIITHISNIVKDDKITKSDFIKNMILVMSCPIKNADWGEQNKEKLALPAKIIEQYSIDSKYLSNIAILLTEPYFKKLDAKKNTVAQSLQYIPAKYSDTKPSQCSLLVAEGNSALGMLNFGLGLKSGVKSGINRNYYGTFSVQGVILNAAREISEIKTPDGRTIYHKHEKLRDCVRINQLRLAIGLDYDKKYETEDEIKSLHYGRIIICTDEDLDGVGKIAPLIMVLFYYFWPALFKRGMVYRFKTPLIRVISNGKKTSFYNEQEFEDANIKPGSDVRYYKGLATHEDDDVVEMFAAENFATAVMKFTIENDEECKKMFHTYYGNEPELRRNEMRQEVAKLQPNITIPIVAETLCHDAKLYKLDAIKRQLPHVIDGLNPARRKVIATAMIQGMLPPVGKQSKKIFQFGAEVTSKMAYHHGDAPICKTIIYLGQCFENHRFYPLLQRSGQFGDRHGHEAGAPRYIGINSSPFLRQLLREDDEKILDITMSEGKYLEPEFYVPILPFHILESSEAPSEGWANVTYGRDLKYVINILKRYINNEMISPEFSEIDPKHPNYLPPNMGNNKGKLREINGRIYSFGIYEIQTGTKITKIIVTELPLGVLTINYIERFQHTITDSSGKEIENTKMQLINKIVRLDNGDNVYIEFHIDNTNLEIINKKWGDDNFTPIEHFLLLYTSLSNSNLNFYSIDNKVIEFGNNYLAALLYWANYRKNMYKLRFERMLIVLKARLIMNENILRYLSDYHVNNVSVCKSDDEFNKLISSHNFVKLNEGYIRADCYDNVYTKCSDINKKAFSESYGASYEYLIKLGSPRDLFDESLKKRELTIENIKSEILRVEQYLMEDPPGKSVWLSELEKITI